MVGGYGFQLSVSYRVLFDTVDRSLIGHYRTIAEIAGFQFFLHPQIEQHTNCDVFRLRNEFLFLIVSDCFSEQGFCFRQGISEAKILEVKQTEIHEKASQSIKSKGWLPNLFRGIVAKAKDFLQNLIREKDMPPKPTLDIDMAEFRHMRNLMIKVQDKAKEIKNLQDKVLPQLKQQLADTKGLFKDKERKALEVKIKETEAEIADRLDKIPDTLKEDGYPDVQVFMRTFREMESVVEQYNRDLAEWEYQVSRKSTTAAKGPHRPPERQSVLKHLREIQERNRQKPPQRQRKKSIDRDSR